MNDCMGRYLLLHYSTTRHPWRKRILVDSPDLSGVDRLIDDEYGKPELYELNGETQVSVLPDIVI